MSGLETLPPDQRAVLQLILVQGRGYADLAALLTLDVDAVRSRAHAAIDGLGDRTGSGAALDPDERARVADYLLGQQDDGERIVTFAALGESAAACRWAQALREQLAGVARTELPAVPSVANGAAPLAAAVGAATVAAEEPAVDASSPPSAAERAPSPLGDPRGSRVGGIVLIAGAAVLAIVLAIVLIGGDGDGGASGSAAATTPAQTQATRTQPSTTPASQPQVVAQVNLTPAPAGGDALGVGLVQRGDGRSVLAIEAQRLPANGAQDIYAVWLQGDAGTRFLGFVPRQVRAGGSFTVSAALPRNARRYQTVLVTREGVTAVPSSPGETILSGALRLPS